MEHIGSWHDSDLSDGSIRPSTNCSIQVRCLDGNEVEGQWFRGAFSSATPMRSTVITAWRHLKGVID